MSKLNFGCGGEIKTGWENVDIRALPHVSKIFDFNKYPYPLKTGKYEEILAKHILEHLDNPIRCLREFIRISQPNAKLVLIVPHAYSYANQTDLQHKVDFTENSFSENLLEEYLLKELKLVKRSFLFHHKWKRFLPFKNFFKIFLNGIYDSILFEFRIKK